jgi:hypothetical protein
MAAIMRSITSEGFEVGKAEAAGPAPMLQWIKISDLVVDPSYQRPIVGEGKRNVDRIARDFRWAFFAPVVVSPVEGGRFRDHRRPASYNGRSRRRDRNCTLPSRDRGTGRAGGRLQGDQRLYYPDLTDGTSCCGPGG